MYLSRLLLDPRSRTVRQDTANCYALHQRVMEGFPSVQADGNARARLGILHRLDVEPRGNLWRLLVQSRVEPSWRALPSGYLLTTDDNPACKEVGRFYATVSVGRLLQFRLRANPTKKIDTKSGPDGRRRNGKRVELRSVEEQLAWLRRKGEDAGFVALQAVPRPDKVAGARRADVGGGARMTFGAVVFDGVLRVTDADRFREALVQGVGSAKAFGFGLLSVAPVR